jgi:uncharacterized protein (TIGR02145 family)
MLRILLILIFVTSSFSAFTQQFANLRAKKEAGKVLVSYDFSTGKVGQTFDIRLECSVDGGMTFNLFPQFVSGDLKEISAGIGKRIIWDKQSERSEFNSDQLVFQLVAVENVLAVTIPENAGTFADPRDGHIYNWIKIGNQIWMVENLAFLPAVSPSREGSQSKPFYYVSGYNGVNLDEAKATGNYKTYGALYNWSAAVKACPAGWHLPTDEEWKQLEVALGMSQKKANTTGTRGAEFGAKMKSSDGWYKLGNGTNESRFSALPGGGRYDDGSFGNAGSNGYWWSASEFDRNFAWGRGLGFESSEIYKGVNYKEGGFSIRCIKD